MVIMTDMSDLRVHLNVTGALSKTRVSLHLRPLQRR
jgi:hypothetical protein